MLHSSDIRPDIMGRITDAVTHMTEHHNKVLPIRFDVRYPIGFTQRTDDNRLISLFIARLADSYVYRGIAFKYVWAREVAGSEHVGRNILVKNDGGGRSTSYSLKL